MMTENKLKKDCLFWNGYTLLQEKKGFRFSFDAVLLACFFRCHAKDSVLDAATGSGVLPLLLLAKEPALDIIGLELEEDACLLGQRNMTENKVSAKIQHGDAMKMTDYFAENTFDAVIANPPYYKKDALRLPKNPKIAMAKAEVCWDSKIFFANVRKVLKKNGTLTLSYPKERQEEIEKLAQTQGFFPSRRLFVKATPTKDCYLVIFEFVKNGTCAETIDATTIIADKDGKTHPMMEKILKERSCAF